MLTSDFNNWDKGIFSVVGVPGGPENTKTSYWYRRDCPGLNTNSIYSDTDITYRWNTHGFRSDEFVDDGQDSIMVVGDSCTIGIGCPFEHTWPSILREKFPNTKLYNLGLAAASSDYVVRAIAKTIDVLCPRAVFVQWPMYSSREMSIRRRCLPYRIYLENYDGGISISKRMEQAADIFNDNSYIKYQFDKNLIMIREICKNRKIPLQEINLCKNEDLESFDVYAYERDFDPRRLDNVSNSLGHEFGFPRARDKIHFGHEWNAYFADLLYSQYLKNK
jgi:hypothetical protein